MRSINAEQRLFSRKSKRYFIYPLSLDNILTSTIYSPLNRSVSSQVINGSFDRSMISIRILIKNLDDFSQALTYHLPGLLIRYSAAASDLVESIVVFVPLVSETYNVLDF